MLFHCLGERAEDYPLVSQCFPGSSSNGNRIEYGIHRDACKSSPFIERNPELFECGFELRVNLLGPVAVLLGRRIIDYILEINLRDIKMRPCGHLHFLPPAESFKPELQQPLGLVLLCRDQPDYILVQSLWNELLLHISDETMLILLARYILQYIFLCLLVHNKSIDSDSRMEWRLPESANIAIFWILDMPRST